MLADTRGQASINAASVQHELRNNELILRDYGHLKYRRIDDPRPEPTLESDEHWQAMTARFSRHANASDQRQACPASGRSTLHQKRHGEISLLGGRLVLRSRYLKYLPGCRCEERVQRSHIQRRAGICRVD